MEWNIATFGRVSLTLGLSSFLMIFINSYLKGIRKKTLVLKINLLSVVLKLFMTIVTMTTITIKLFHNLHMNRIF